ncbi:MAG: hypothetical protein WAT93_05545 [Pontixanthobacter sp.]
MGATLCAFLLGGLVVGYITWDGSPRLGGEPAKEVAALAGVKPDAEAENTPEDQAPPTAEETASASKAVERVEEQQGGLDQRLAAAEQRLARLDLQAQAASGNAARAEGLLIAFATRRSLERGAELGYLADQLRLRFSDALPNAVNTIIETSRDPITLDQLIARLEGLAPKLAATTSEPSFDRFKREISELFVVRREDAPSPQPERRVERARFFLQSGRVSSAVKEVENLPGAVNAKDWIADANRYAAAQRALDLIETAAVVEPQRLRDGDGTPIKQPTPVRENVKG